MISVIMPVYNVGNFVKDSIESVLRQTYNNFELIIVNDGSTDHSKEVISQYSGNPKIKIINQKNQGLSAARNTGLNFVNGDFIYFIDSDDVINHNLFQLLIDEFNRKKDLDLISFGYKEFKTESSILDKSLTTERREIISSNQALKKLMNYQIFQMAWSYIVKSSVILDNDIKFSEGKLFEDNNSAAKIFSKCKNVEQVYINPAPYLLRARDTSITAVANNLHSLREFEDELFIFNDEYNVFLENGSNDLATETHTWYFNKLNKIYIKYYLSLYRKYPQKFLAVRRKSSLIYSKYDLNLTLRDKERWLRVKSRVFNKVIRVICGDRRKLK